MSVARTGFDGLPKPDLHHGKPQASDYDFIQGPMSDFPLPTPKSLEKSPATPTQLKPEKSFIP